MTEPTPAPGRTLVVIPTYDERENVELIVSRLRRAVPAADVLVVDDNSPDGTGAVADALAAQDDQVHVLHRLGKGGLGAAYLAGFAWGLGRDYDAVVEMDADGSHQPEQLPSMLAALADADLVIGSRWVRGGAVQNWPLHRKVLSRGANTYTRTLLGIAAQDATAGFRAFRATTLRQLDLHDVASQGYCFQIDLAWRAAQRGLRVVEVPITFVERERGQSKMSGAIIRESLVKVSVWGLRHRLGQLAAMTGRGAPSRRRPSR